jgi:hypothetical protein
VALFKVKDPKSGKVSYLSPTLAHYLMIENDSSAETVYASDESARKLIESRQNPRLPLYARLYRKHPGANFELLTDINAKRRSRILTGAVPLSACARPPEIMNESQLDLGLEEIMDTINKELSPLSAKAAPDKFLDLETKGNGAAQIKISKDLSAIDVFENGKSVHLSPITSGDRATVVYQDSKSKGYRAAAIYKDSDLSQIERVFIETPNLVYEVISCEIGKECYR